jgi:type III pantothenate kinase
MPYSTDLVLDMGNSRTKAALIQQGLVKRTLVLDNGDVQALTRWLDGTRPGRIALGSVAAGDKALARQLAAIAPVHLITSEGGSPLRTAYTSMNTLGVDRAANALAAHHLFPGRATLAVDMGTCITYDLVDADGTYLGGAIAPGVRMRAAAMHAYSARLPLVDIVPGTPHIGVDTEGSLQSGLYHGVRHELAGMVRAYAKFFPDVAVVITGGDAPGFASAVELGIFADPLLTIKGLHAILLHQDSAGNPAGAVPHPSGGGTGH